MILARARRCLLCLPALAWLAAAPASGVEVMVRSGIQAVPMVQLAPLAAPAGGWTPAKLVSSLTLGVSLLAPHPSVQTVPAPKPVAASPVLSPAVKTPSGKLPTAPILVERIGSILRGFAHGQQAAQLNALFDGEKRTDADDAKKTPVPDPALRESQPGFQPHDSVPSAFLPGGKAIPPDSFIGGYHGTEVDPETVQQRGGFSARGPVEDWRLREHAEQESKPVSAFRGTTPFPTSPDGEAGAALWAGEGNWVYDITGVPTWEVDAKLEGRIERGGSFRGSLMKEVESAIPAQTPLECIRRWGRVSESSSGKLFVRANDWVPNPRFDPAVCQKFWGAGAAPSGS
ncbi:MAG: hypothetical protein NTY77_06125 [Elusimicrobia bacterium]|nr:hypothetical protein [Elusimicrobiota bacterium]